MLFIHRILVGTQERVFVIRHRRFIRVLEPGVHWIFGLGYFFEYHQITELVLTSEWTEYIRKNRPDVVERYFAPVATGETEVALIWADGKLERVVGPGSRELFWLGFRAIRVDIVNTADEPQIPAALIPAVARATARKLFVLYAVVEEGKSGILYLDNRFVRELGAGNYAFWNVAAVPRVDVVDLRLQALDVTGQEILTKDKVSLRVNISALFTVLEPVRAKASVKDYSDHLYRLLQLAVRESLGRRTLEELLADKTVVDAEVAAEVVRDMALIGVRVSGIALKDIVLPGEVREILNQVVAAEKQAQANLIRRREETAATRSLLNTARLLEGNPILVRLKELETLEKVAEKVDRIAVADGFDTLLHRVVKIGSS